MEFRKRRWAWFINGTVAGLLFIATMNSLSFFFRSGGWDGLLKRRAHPQAIGFPWEIWRYGVTYENGSIVDTNSLMFNIAAGLLIGIVLGLLAIWNRDWLRRLAVLIVPWMLGWCIGGLRNRG